MTLEDALAAVDWTSLSHAWNTATAADVPDLVRRVVASPRDADLANKLCEWLNHQGSLYAATIPAFPAVLAAAAAVPGGSPAHRTLTSLAGGILAGALDPERGPDRLAALAALAPHRERLVDACEPERTADPQLRDQCVFLATRAASLSAQAGAPDLAFVDAIRRTLGADPHPVVRASAAFGLEPIADLARTELVAALTDSAAPALAAATVLVRKSAPPALALDLVCACICGAPGAPNHDAFVVLSDDGSERWRCGFTFFDVRHAALAALVTYLRAYPAEVERQVEVLAAALARSTGRLGHLDVEPILRLAFPGRWSEWVLVNGRMDLVFPPPPGAADLTPVARAVVRAVLANPRIRSSSLRDVGLPADPAAAMSFLDA